MKDNPQEIQSKENVTLEDWPVTFLNVNSSTLPNEKNIALQDLAFDSFGLSKEKLIVSNSSKKNTLIDRWKPVNNLTISSSNEKRSTFEKNIENETSNSSDHTLLNCPTTPLIEQLIVISHLLLAINSSANVIIYLFIGKLSDSLFIVLNYSYY